MKHCPKCSTNKPPEEFSGNKREKDGLAAYCKSCYSEVMKAWRLKHKNTSAKPVIPPPNWNGRNR